VIPVLRHSSLGGVPHAVTNRQGGVSDGPFSSLNLGYSTADAEDNVAANRSNVLADLRMERDSVFSGWLTHGNAVSEFHAGEAEAWPVVRASVRAGSDRTEMMFRSDAAVSDVPGLYFLVTFADCAPVLLADPGRGVVAIAHAGWRGTAAGVAAATVRVMCGSFGCSPKHVVAAIGPSIGPCCYRVGPDVADEFRAHANTPVIIERTGGMYLDLRESNARQLTEIGVRSEALEISTTCTSCHSATYFSHRAAGGITGRFGACIGLPSA